MTARKSPKPSLHVVPATDNPSGPNPPRTLGQNGMNLWLRILDEFHIDDCAGRELLALACEQLDRAESLKSQINAAGEVVQTRTGLKAHPALRHELQARAFVMKALGKLGLNDEPVQRPGRPPSAAGKFWTPDDDN
jgi:hypothetical protein